MASQTPNVSPTAAVETAQAVAVETPGGLAVVSDIPRIEVTEPSPLVRNISTAVSTNVAEPVSVTIEERAVPVTQQNGEVVLNGSDGSNGAVPVIQQNGDVRLNGFEGSSGEFSPVPECTQCPDESLPETAVDVQDEPSREIEESGENDLRSLPQRCSIFRTICRSYVSCLNSFTDPKCLLPLQLMLLAVPVASGFLGARYIDDCPGNPPTPMLLFMIGITATITVLCRMCVTIRVLMLEGHPEWWMLKTITIFTILILILLLTTEMLSFFQFSPSFEYEDEDYCDPIFYNYSYWMNWGFLALTALICLIYVPACVHDNFIPQQEFDV